DTAVIQVTSFTNTGTLDIGSDSVMEFSATPLTNQGLIELAGGTLESTAVIENANGTIKGFGTIDAAVHDNGLIEANGGTLTVLHAVTDNGLLTDIGLQVDAGATLVLDGPVDTSVGLRFDGSLGSTLEIAQPASFHSVIYGIGLDDVIDLGGVIA